jgi:hypothetical protein
MRGRFLSGNANCHRGTGATRGDLERGFETAVPRKAVPLSSESENFRSLSPSDFDEVRKCWRTTGTLSSADVEPVVMA